MQAAFCVLLEEGSTVSNQDFYPPTLPQDPRRPVRVLFRVNASPEEIRRWYLRTLESLKSQRQRDDEALQAAYGERWGGTPRPAPAQLLRPEPAQDGEEMIAHELPDVIRLDFHPGAGGTTVEARCWGGLTRRTFDAVLATAADTFPESRGDLQRAAAEFRLPDLSKALDRRVPAGNREEPVAVPAGSRNGGTAEDGAPAGDEPIYVRARRLGFQSKRFERMMRIEREHTNNGLSQQKMAELEDVAVRTIRQDVADMKRYPEDFPNTVRHFSS